MSRQLLDRLAIGHSDHESASSVSHWDATEEIFAGVMIHSGTGEKLYHTSQNERRNVFLVSSSNAVYFLTPRWLSDTEIYLAPSSASTCSSADGENEIIYLLVFRQRAVAICCRCSQIIHPVASTLILSHIQLSLPPSSLIVMVKTMGTARLLQDY